MTQQTINIGSAADDGTGDPARTAFNKVNQNFTELYASVGTGAGQLIFTGFDGGTASTTVFDLTLDLGAA